MQKVDVFNGRVSAYDRMTQLSANSDVIFFPLDLQEGTTQLEVENYFCDFFDHTQMVNSRVNYLVGEDIHFENILT